MVQPDPSRQQPQEGVSTYDVDGEHDDVAPFFTMGDGLDKGSPATAKEDAVAMELKPAG